MSDTRFGDGVLVKCPGCQAEVSAEQLPIDPEARFRCHSCQDRGLDTMRMMIADQARKEKANAGQGKPDNNRKSKPAPSRSDKSRDRPVEQQQQQAVLDDDGLDQPSHQ
ncbi:hypothetical protein Q9L58_010744 [Maublancomyces gigas]|uniref:Uncharacterized protein n=1 Tax=Discina gigas TaxID=1032678 RepID=A0ABR3G399_9PEZI